MVEENRRLHAMTYSTEPNTNSTALPAHPVMTSIADMINHPQKLMAMVFPSQFISVVQTWDHMFLPSRSQSLKLIQHGKLWTSWIHCAIDYREFEASHENFWDHLESGGTIQQRNPSWLAIYFGLLAVSSSL